MINLSLIFFLFNKSILASFPLLKKIKVIPKHILVIGHLQICHCQRFCEGGAQTLFLAALDTFPNPPWSLIPIPDLWVNYKQFATPQGYRNGAPLG